MGGKKDEKLMIGEGFFICFHLTMLYWAEDEEEQVEMSE